MKAASSVVTFAGGTEEMHVPHSYNPVLECVRGKRAGLFSK